MKIRLCQMKYKIKRVVSGLSKKFGLKSVLYVPPLLRTSYGCNDVALYFRAVINIERVAD